MDIALEGHDPDDPADAVILVAPSLLDIPVVAGPLVQARLEDMQAFSFLAAVSMRGSRHPIQLVDGEDPPDRYWQGMDGPWGLELTVLTVEQLRGDLARARAFGRRVAEAIAADPDEYCHLRRRLVEIAPETMQLPALPRDQTDMVKEIAELLKADKGTLFDDVVVDGGLPPQFTSNRGVYGKVGPFDVRVQPLQSSVSDAPLVSASVGFEIKTSQALALLRERVREKDEPKNDLVLITCGLPDKKGYQTGFDTFLYHLLKSAIEGSETPVIHSVDHIRGVALHLWPTNDWIEVYNAGGLCLPWHA